MVFIVYGQNWHKIYPKKLQCYELTGRRNFYGLFPSNFDKIKNDSSKNYRLALENFNNQNVKNLNFEIFSEMKTNR